MTVNEYKTFVDNRAKRSKCFVNILKAFVSGGIICLIGEGLGFFFEYSGIDIKDSRTLVSVSLIFLSGLLTGIGIYDKIAKFAGAGTLVPITGFSNAVASPAIESKTEGFINGIGAKMFVIAGPVIVYGIGASILYGVIYYLTGAI